MTASVPRGFQFPRGPHSFAHACACARVNSFLTLRFSRCAHCHLSPSARFSRDRRPVRATVWRATCVPQWFVANTTSPPTSQNVFASRLAGCPNARFAPSTIRTASASRSAADNIDAPQTSSHDGQRQFARAAGPSGHEDTKSPKDRNGSASTPASRVSAKRQNRGEGA